MKYLKEFNSISNLVSEIYLKEIKYLVNKRKLPEITTNILSKINSILDKNEIKLKQKINSDCDIYNLPNCCNIKYYNSRKKWPGPSLKLIIIPLEDEWFICGRTERIYPLGYDVTFYYKCDGYDGLDEFLREFKFIKHNKQDIMIKSRKDSNIILESTKVKFYEEISRLEYESLSQNEIGDNFGRYKPNIPKYRPENFNRYECRKFEEIFKFWGPSRMDKYKIDGNKLYLEYGGRIFGKEVNIYKCEDDWYFINTISRDAFAFAMNNHCSIERYRKFYKADRFDNVLEFLRSYDIKGDTDNKNIFNL